VECKHCWKGGQGSTGTQDAMGSSSACSSTSSSS
jgi:hypothetical protein